MKRIKQKPSLLGVVFAMIILLGMASCSENGRGSKKITTTEWKEYDGNYIKAAFPDSSFMYFQVMDESHVRLVSSNKKYGYITYSGDLEIPESIKSNGKKYQVSSIGEALRESNVTSVVIPNTVTAIDNYAFDNCQELTNVRLPEELVSIGDYSFVNCTSLASLTVPKTVKSLGKEVFHGCTNLTDLVLPDGLTLPKSESKLKGYEWLEGVWAGAEGPETFGRVIVTDSYFQVVNSNWNNSIENVEDMEKQDYVLKTRKNAYDGYDDDGEVFGFNEYVGVDEKGKFIYIIQGEYQSIILDKIQEDSFEKMIFKANHNYPPRDAYAENASNEPNSVKNTYTVNGVSFVMKEVEGGTFQMGRNDTDSQWERPAHSVTVSSFNIGETEVTQGLWNAVMGRNPSRYKGNDLPVEDVSYNDIVNEFLPKLNQLTGKNFRLPTEAEWEFAARGGNYSKGYQYAGSPNLNDVAWYWQNTGDTFLGGTDDNWDWNTISNNNGSTRNVKGKLPNELGIYGMSGNVWEWCSDEWHAYKSISENNPKYYGNAGSSRVLRGGCWCSRTGDCRVTFRCGKKPDEHFPKWGFRLALTQ